MEGNYRQNSMYLAFILIMLTSLFFSLSDHFIAFISMTQKKDIDVLINE